MQETVNLSLHPRWHTWDGRQRDFAGGAMRARKRLTMNQSPMLHLCTKRVRDFRATRQLTLSSVYGKRTGFMFFFLCFFFSVCFLWFLMWRARPYRFFQVGESFRASTRAGLTRVRPLSTWVYSERNAVTHLSGHSPSHGISCSPESDVSKKSREKREKLSRERLLSEVKYRCRENAPFSVLRPQNALKTPRLRLLKS